MEGVTSVKTAVDFASDCASSIGVCAVGFGVTLGLTQLVCRTMGW
jgi:hypothetical protein